MINWIPLNSVEQVHKLADLSAKTPCVIFKHSSRCDLSEMSRLTLEKDWNIPEKEIYLYFLDVIQYPKISKEVSDYFMEHHETPQLLHIKDGFCTYIADHQEISFQDFKDFLINER